MRAAYHTHKHYLCGLGRMVTIGLQIQALNASTSREIEGASAPSCATGLTHCSVSPDSFFISRDVQLVTSAARLRIPSAYPYREIVEAGGLMNGWIPSV